MAYSEKEKDKVFNRILDEIENGRSLRQILKSEGNPSSQTFYKWLKEDDVKSKQYARSCEERAIKMFEEILYIADDDTQDAMVITTENSSISKVDMGKIQRARLKIDARKWMLSKMQPKKYGDKLDVTTDGDKVSPLGFTVIKGKDDNK